MPIFSDYGNSKIRFRASDGKIISAYVGKKAARAFNELAGDPRALLTFESFYRQGKKDGWREIIEEADKLKGRFNYLNPGKPKRRAPRTKG